ncbi:hypothetical protein GCM10027341_03690 [Spirosoma knui]
METAITDAIAKDNTELIGSRVERIDPDNFRNQPNRGDGPVAMEDGDADRGDGSLETEDDGVSDEPVDEDGDPTGEHDHHQDDNYALGGHVTRSGSV